MTHSPEQLKRALKISQDIQKLQAELASLLGGSSKRGSGGVLMGAATKRNMSPEGRARIAEAQKKRWEKVRKEKKKAQKGE